MDDDAWKIGPKTPQLLPHEIHVWQITFDEKTTPSLQTILSADEHERANRFHFSEHRHKFIQARGYLRLLLARYLGIEPNSIRFAYNDYGKPALPDPYQWLQFNLSHAHDIAVYAFNRHQNIGVDLEYMNRSVNIQQIARQFFAPTETTTLLQLPEKERLQSFFNCWTRKEAFIKARGRGLSIPLDSFTVSLAPDEPAQLLAIRDADQSLKSWQMKKFSPQSDYVGAIAVQGTIDVVRYWLGT